MPIRAIQTPAEAVTTRAAIVSCGNGSMLGIRPGRGNGFVVRSG